MADWEWNHGAIEGLPVRNLAFERPHNPELGRAGLVDFLTDGLLRQDLLALFSIVPLITI